MTKDNETNPGTIKVVDRRRFHVSGERRAEAAHLPDPEKPKAPAAAATPEKDKSGHVKTGYGDFLGFVGQLAQTALAAMGLLPETQARGMPVDFQLARHYIDILGMLHERTKGNLTKEEDTTFQRILTELRMQMVEITKAAQQATHQHQ